MTGKPCGRPTSRADKSGLSAFTCRYHQQFKQRHGSHWCRSPPAKIVRPYIAAADDFLRSKANDPYVVAAVAGLDGLMASAGYVEIATRLKGLLPDRRARIAMARLREANIKPERLLAITIAVHALIKAEPALTHRVREWRIVAIAKAAHRLASGYHRVWVVRDDAGRIVQQTALHAYPRSSGRVLQHLGDMIEKESELVIDHHLPAVLALKEANDRSLLPASG